MATLWQLAWNENRVRCSVYRRANGFQLRVESPSATIVSEPFDLEPRAMARARALRGALERRGWSPVTDASAPWRPRPR